MSDTTTPAPQKPGFELEGKFFPFPTAFRLGDPVLVTELTGMNFNDFAEALDDPAERENPVVLVGLIGVAIWQEYPRWTRQKVLRYVQQVDLEQFEAVAGDVGDAEEASDAPLGESTTPSIAPELPDDNERTQNKPVAPV